MYKLVFFICLGNAIAQENNTPIKDSIEWNEGKIVLNNGQILEGVLHFDQRHGILGFNRIMEPRSFTTNKVQSFEYFDSNQKQHRKFYSIEIKDFYNNEKRRFVEVLREFDGFAILAFQYGPFYKIVTTYERHSVKGKSAVSNVLIQDDIIYFLDSDGKISPYLITTKEGKEKTMLQGIGRPSIQTKILGKDKFENLTKTHIAELKKYAKETNLKFDKRDDFLRILDYYDQLMRQ